ncbi:hypothetical protein Tco_0287351 [Tanacetum coccineum]
MALLAREDRHQWLQYRAKGYIEDHVQDFKHRLETLFSRTVNQVHVLDFEGVPVGMRIGDDTGLDVEHALCFSLGGGRWSMTWRRFILALGLHITEEIAETRISFDTDFLTTVPSYRSIWDPVRRLYHMLIAMSISGRVQAPKKVTATDLFYLRSMDEETAVNIPYLLGQYLFRHAEGRKSRARMSGGHFVGQLARDFSLVTDERLRGLSDCVAPRAKRQPAIAAAVPEMDEGAPDVDEGVQADPAPIQEPPPPPTM